jgi:hypothetical protein
MPGHSKTQCFAKKYSDYTLWMKTCGLFKFFSYIPWHVYISGPAAQEISTYLVNYVVYRAQTLHTARAYKDLILPKRITEIGVIIKK